MAQRMAQKVVGKFGIGFLIMILIIVDWIRPGRALLVELADAHRLRPASDHLLAGVGVAGIELAAVWRVRMVWPRRGARCTLENA